MEDKTKELQDWRELQERFPASAWVTFLYAKFLQKNSFDEYERLKPRLLLSFFDRKRFHQFTPDEAFRQTSDFTQSEPSSFGNISNIPEKELEKTPLIEEKIEVKTEEKPQEVSEKSTPEKAESTHADEEIIDNLIEKFSNDPPKIQFNPEIHDENYNYGKSSCIENPEIISETLALIFAEQGYVGKAIKIYKKLSLHNPEKSCYFADQIKKLKTEKK